MSDRKPAAAVSNKKAPCKSAAALSNKKIPRKSATASNGDDSDEESDEEVLQADNLRDLEDDYKDEIITARYILLDGCLYTRKRGK